MIAAVLGLASVALAASFIGLIALGARWRRGGLHICVAYSAVIAAAAYAAGNFLWLLPGPPLGLGVALVAAAPLGAYALKRDWNPPAQAFLGLLILTSVTFVTFTARVTFSGAVAPVAVPAGALVLALEAFALALGVVGAHEVLDVVGRVRWHRRTTGISRPNDPPFVSIHVATHNEPPELVIETLRSLVALDYPAYEVVVLDNNTVDEELWRPVERFCQDHDIRFVHLANWPGFKAGALNHGLRISDPRTEVIALIDADFIVERDFLDRTVGYFEDPKVGIVQTAQDFRTEGPSRFLRRLRLTYRAFDEVTMPSRNERNAIIFAGTMGLIRKGALLEAGGWAEWCVTEDAELSLRILGHGYRSVYVERVFGRGVMPLTFAALKRQRFRWCFGGIQILRRHWRVLLTGKGTDDYGTQLRLSLGQRYDYLTGALQWFQAVLTLAFASFLLLGGAAVALGHTVRIRPLTGFFIAVPSLLAATGILKSVWGLRARLGATRRDAVAVMGVWVSLTWAVALGCIQAILKPQGAFLRTPKFKERDSLRQAFIAARAETPLAIALTATAVATLRAGMTTRSLFLAGLCSFTALVFWSSPITAFIAARTDLGSAALERRRRLEWLRGRIPVQRRHARYAAVAAAAACASLLIGASTLGTGTEADDLGEVFGLPRRDAGSSPDQPDSANGETASEPIEPIAAAKAAWARATLAAQAGTANDRTVEPVPDEGDAPSQDDGSQRDPAPAPEDPTVPDPPTDGGGSESGDQVDDTPGSGSAPDDPGAPDTTPAPQPTSKPTPTKPSPQPTGLPTP